MTRGIGCLLRGTEGLKKRNREDEQPGQDQLLHRNPGDKEMWRTLIHLWRRYRQEMPMLDQIENSSNKSNMYKILEINQIENSSNKSNRKF